ncbi:MAG: HAD family phosphatase [Bdellovibrionota bacterium]
MAQIGGADRSNRANLELAQGKIADSRVQVVSEFLIANTVKALILDLDGTVANTHAIHAKSFFLAAEVLFNRDVTVEEQELIGDPCRLSETQISKLIVQTMCAEQFSTQDSNEFDLQMAARLIQLRRKFFKDLLRSEQLLLNLGIDELIHDCSVRGIRLGICTGSPYAIVNILLENFNLRDDFEDDIIISADDYRGHDGKPAPYCWELAVKFSGLKPEEILALENNSMAVASMRAGLNTILCPSEYGLTQVTQVPYLANRLKDYTTLPDVSTSIVSSWQDVRFSY